MVKKIRLEKKICALHSHPVMGLSVFFIMLTGRVLWGWSRDHCTFSNMESESVRTEHYQGREGNKSDWISLGWGWEIKNQLLKIHLLCCSNHLGSPLKNEVKNISMESLRYERQAIINFRITANPRLLHVSRKQG